MSGDYSSRNRRMLKRFLPYYKKYSGLFALDMFCSAMTTVCEIALPLIVRQITDRAAHDIHDLTAELIIKIVGFYILLRIIDTAASYYTASGGHIMGARIETDMRNDLFSHLQDMSYSFYDDTKIGQLMSRITNDLFDITELAHHGPENVLMTVIKIVAGFIMFASMNIWLAIIVFSLMPLMMLLTSHSRRKMRAAFKQQRREIGEINARTEDSLLGIRVVKSFANEDIEREKFNEGSRRFFKSKKNGYRYMASFHCTVRLCDGLMYIAIVGVGAVFMMKGKTTVGDFSASLLMVSTLLAAIRTMVEFSEQFNRGMTGIERFTEIMETVGQVMETLKKLNLDDNTIVILSSDNGAVIDDGYKDQAVELLGNHKATGVYRGGKYSSYEGGTRVPCVIRWKGKIPAGVSDNLVSQIDWFASFASMCGVNLPEGSAPDSENHLDSWLKADVKGRSWAVEQNLHNNLSITDGVWKYIPAANGPAVNKQTNTELGNNPKADQLYNLLSDPGEHSNVAEENKELVQKMRDELIRIVESGLHIQPGYFISK